MRRDLRGGLLVALVAAGACDAYYDRVPSPDDALKLVPWFDHMIASPAVHPYESGTVPRLAVPGTVPVTRTEADWEAAWNGGNWAVADPIRNPGADPAAGVEAYDIYCAVCHGPVGAGDGPVGRRVGAPSLLTERARGWSDGHLYSVIRYGRGVMPRYGDKLVDPAVRWAVVSYVRRLQAEGQAGAGGGGD